MRPGTVVLASFAAAANRRFNKVQRVPVVVVSASEDGRHVDLLDEAGAIFLGASVTTLRQQTLLSTADELLWATVYEKHTGQAMPRYDDNEVSSRESRARKKRARPGELPHAADAVNAAGASLC
jgi:hypothetical protein